MTLDIMVIIKQMVILFSAVAIGFIATKYGALGADAPRHFSDMVILIANPCMSLYSVLGSERVLSNLEVVELTLIAIGVYGSLMLLAIGIPKLLRVQGPDAGLYRFMLVFSNVGFMGYPLLRALYGPGSVFYGSIFNLVFQILAYTYGSHQIAPNHPEAKFSWKMALQPNIIASLLGYIFYLTDFKAPELVVSVIGFIEPIGSALSMLTIGCILATVPIRQVFGTKPLYPLLILKQIILPVVYYLILSQFVTNQLMLAIVVVMVSVPVAALSAVLSTRLGANRQLGASGVFLSTLLSLVSIPFVMWLLLIR